MHIFLISGRDYDSNVYVITGSVPTIVDTGTGFHSNDVLKNIQKRVDPLSIKQIILTHEHFDHVGGVLDILKATKNKAKVFAHYDTVEKLKEGRSTFAEMLGGTMPKVEVNMPLKAGEHLVLGDDDAGVLITPGHSLGSLCLYVQKRKALFSGDTVFAGGGFGRYDFPGGNLKKLEESLCTLASLDVTHLYPGHGPTVEGNAKVHLERSYENIRLLE